MGKLCLFCGGTRLYLILVCSLYFSFYVFIIFIKVYVIIVVPILLNQFLFINPFLCAVSKSNQYKLLFFNSLFFIGVAWLKIRYLLGLKVWLLFFAQLFEVFLNYLVIALNNWKRIYLFNLDFIWQKQFISPFECFLLLPLSFPWLRLFFLFPVRIKIYLCQGEREHCRWKFEDAILLW